MTQQDAEQIETDKAKSKATVSYYGKKQYSFNPFIAEKIPDYRDEPSENSTKTTR